MAEVRTIQLDGHSQSGIFATRQFEQGEVILRESNPWKLQPTSTTEDQHHAFQNRSKQHCMASAMMTFRQTPESDREWLLQLYHGNNNKLDGMVDQVWEWIRAKELETAPTKAEESSMRVIAGIWAHNAFAGGRIYRMMSRLNHSCQPNAIVQTESEDTQSIRALRTIHPDEEITISYIPTEYLYSETKFRNKMLEETKYFTCHCPRCENAEEPATAIPCHHCHPRSGILPEDVQYDDEQTVQYAWKMTPKDYKCSTCGQAFHREDIRTHCTVTDKISVFLGSYQHNEKNDERGSLLEYTSLSSSVNGSLHWTTNILLYYQLDLQLQDFHKNMMEDTNQEPNSDQIAEFIDTLQRLCRFIQHSKFSFHRGHWIGDVIIGTARALVALGDVKSQRYAAEWLTEEDFDGFVRKFEPEDLRKVVDRLRTAWTQNSASDETSNKRRKT